MSGLRQLVGASAGGDSSLTAGDTPPQVRPLEASTVTGLSRATAQKPSNLPHAVSNLSLESQCSLPSDGNLHVHPSTLGRYVRLNVGGSIFYTTLDTLCKQDTMLRAMFTGNLEVQTDKEG